MGGGLMQLVSYGAQDVYISGNPQITFWKILYKRHTNFAVESIEVTFNGQADFNKRVTAVINRNADLMYKTYLQVVLPEVQPASGQSVRWVHYIGHQLINQVEVEIGGQRIDRQYGDWMQVWTQLSTEAGSVRALNALIGQTADLQFPTNAAGQATPAPCSASGSLKTCGSTMSLPAKTLYIPLQFWFCRNPGVAIPLIALQYHEVRINVEFNPSQLCCWQGNQPNTGANTAYSTLPSMSLAAASLYVDYCYLDTEERRRFAQQSHEYLIEQVQYTGAESITSSSNKIQLNFNHPVKELFWVVQRDSFVDCASTADVQKYYLGIQPFNYSDDYDVSLAAMTSNITGVNLDVNSVGAGQSNVGNTAGATDTAGTTLFLLGKVLLESDVRCEGGNPVEVAKLQLNGQDRFTEREGSYFDRVQPYQHHCRTPSTGINCYSFALRPEEHQPSGTCNFSRIDKATLQLTVSVNTVAANNTAQVRVYALNYNVLRVMSGMGGLAYSN